MKSAIPNNMALINGIQKDIYWYKVQQLCQFAKGLIEPDQNIFELVSGKIDRIIQKNRLIIKSLNDSMDDIEVLKTKVEFLINLANKKLSRS